MFFNLFYSLKKKIYIYMSKTIFNTGFHLFKNYFSSCYCKKKEIQKIFLQITDMLNVTCVCFTDVAQWWSWLDGVRCTAPQSAAAGPGDRHPHRQWLHAQERESPGRRVIVRHRTQGQRWRFFDFVDLKLLYLVILVVAGLFKLGFWCD